jgi:hypothetical protein
LKYGPGKVNEAIARQANENITRRANEAITRHANARADAKPDVEIIDVINPGQETRNPGSDQIPHSPAVNKTRGFIESIDLTSPKLPKALTEADLAKRAAKRAERNQSKRIIGDTIKELPKEKDVLSQKDNSNHGQNHSYDERTSGLSAITFFNPVVDSPNITVDKQKSKLPTPEKESHPNHGQNHPSDNKSEIKLPVEAKDALKCISQSNDEQTSDLSACNIIDPLVNSPNVTVRKPKSKPPTPEKDARLQKDNSNHGQNHPSDNKSEIKLPVEAKDALKCISQSNDEQTSGLSASTFINPVVDSPNVNVRKRKSKPPKPEKDSRGQKYNSNHGQNHPSDKSEIKLPVEAKDVLRCISQSNNEQTSGLSASTFINPVVDSPNVNVRKRKSKPPKPEKDSRPPIDNSNHGPDHLSEEQTSGHSASTLINPLVNSPNVTVHKSKSKPPTPEKDSRRQKDNSNHGQNHPSDNKSEIKLPVEAKNALKCISQSNDERTSDLSGVDHYNPGIAENLGTGCLQVA